jgi:outer membrane protein TolC
MPSLSVSFTEGRNTFPSPSQINGANLTSLSTLTHTFTAGFSQVLTPGTNVGVAFSMARSSSNNQLSTYNPSYTGRVTYTVVQPLLQNFGKSINTRSIAEGLNSQKSSEAAFEIQLSSLIAQAEKAYWNLVFAAQNVSVNRGSLDEALLELEQDKAKVEIGLEAKSDVVQTNTSVAARRQALVTATYAQTQAEDQVKKLISSDTDPGMFRIKLRTLDLPQRTAQIPSLEEAVRIALENRPEMRQALLDMQNKDIDIEYYSNQRKPLLSLTGTYTQNSIGGDQILRGGLGGAASGVKPGGLSDALSQLFGFNYNGYSAGVSFVMPLNNKAVNANYEYAQNQKRMSEANMKATEAQIALDVRNALTEVAQYRDQIENAQATLDLAQQQLENEKTKLELGTSQIRFVLEDQISVATDQTALLQSAVGFANALVDLDQAMGLTLSKNNVQLDQAIKSGGVEPTSPVRSGPWLNLFKNQ